MGCLFENLYGFRIQRTKFLLIGRSAENVFYMFNHSPTQEPYEGLGTFIIFTEGFGTEEILIGQGGKGEFRK